MQGLCTQVDLWANCTFPALAVAAVKQADATLEELAKPIPVDPLIVAAPDLLLSVEELLEEVGAPEKNYSCYISPPCNDCVEYSNLREVIANAKAAIAKARGQE
jgi:predicted Zn-dependent protease